LGKSLGFSTNNAAEIYAIGMLTFKLFDFLNSHPLVKRAVVFSDSKLAIGACASKVPPLANASAIRSLRKLLDFVQTKIKIEFYWIKGHAAVGGNERVDRISKLFANVQGNSDVVGFSGTFDCLSFSAPWVFGFPLSDLPLSFFTSNLPVAPAIALNLNRGSSSVGVPTAAVGSAGTRITRARRVFTAGTRKSDRIAASSVPVLPFDPASLTNTDELDENHGLPSPNLPLVLLTGTFTLGTDSAPVHASKARSVAPRSRTAQGGTRKPARTAASNPVFPSVPVDSTRDELDFKHCD
jgi:ribonuclease HI